MASLTGRLFGNYRILERIGKGGMATVYHADDRKSGRDVAVKFISPALAENEDFLKRFRREVKLVARLDHPSIVPVYDYGEQEGYAYLVMPYLPVGSLTDRMKKGPLSLDEGGKILDQVAAGLDYAHRLGIIHRDVKPSNILLDADGNALLADFGLARQHEATMSLSGSALIGTPAYIAPEQVKGDRVDARCDQYSLGVILFQLASGTLPFEASTPIALALKHVSDPFPSARARSPNVPESVDRVILRATAKEPADRFETVSEMNMGLQAALAHVRDPLTHRAPTIELPRSSAVARAGLPPIRRALKARAVRIGAAVSAGLLLVLALPVFASGLLGLIERAASPAEGGAELSAELSAEQLAAQAATIRAISTQLAGAAGGTFEPGQIETAVMLTLAAMNGPANPETVGLTGPEATVTANASGTTSPGSLTSTSTPGAALTALAGASPPPPATATLATGTAALLTPAPPAATQTPSRTPTQVPTQTPSPTSTQVPTPLPPTPTPNPPTPVPTEDPCGLVSLGGFSKAADAENEVSWLLINDGSTAVALTRIMLNWPVANVRLDRIRFNNATIWNQEDDAPPTDAVPNGDRTLGAGFSKSLRFVFDAVAQASGYQLEVYLNGVCQLSGGG